MADTYDGYDSDGSDVRCKNLDNFDSDDELQFELHESYNNPALVKQGSLKSYEAKKDGTLLFYDDKPSDYSIVADRILWIDGYDNTTAEGQHGREMTLIVLKIVLHSADPESKFKRFTVELRFKDKEALGEHEPLVEAWGPFREPERWNPAVAQREVTGKKEGGGKAGYQGVELSGSRSREEKTSWDQVDFDEGTSAGLFSETTGQRNGVRWTLKQNNVSDLGVTPEVWVAVLLSRTSRRPYVVKFRLDSHGGSRHEIVQGTKRFFRLNPTKTRPFSLTPWEHPICQPGEGERIRDAIDRDNLGKLKDHLDPTKLILPLGPDYHLTPPEVSSRPVAEASGDEDVIRRPIGTGSNESAAASLQRDVPRPQPQRHSVGELSPSNSTATAAPLPAPLTHWHIPADPVRLANLESRVAQAEARINILELMIFELRKASLEVKVQTPQPSV
ncbi:hypothetical protein GGR51DRAFT_542137 [Nemania sp. FL0031]|nr:hypothetical protein GGR51DRAFT_542137 [Nemania sp. FL0031]